MPSTLYTNGTILGLDHDKDRREAIVVDGGRIAGSGPLDAMQALAGPDAATVNLDGATLLPGIVDSHPHAMHFMAYRVGAVDILDATCFDDIVAAIRERAAITKKGEWIVCTPIGEPHYFLRRDYTALAERRMPDRHLLDAAAPEHPVWIMAWAPRTPNVTAFNSLGLERLGVGDQIPDRVCDVAFEKDDRGRLTGVLRGKVNNYYSDDPYWASLVARLPMLPDEIWELAGLGGLQECNALGVTGLYEAHAMMPPHLDAYEKLAASGLCTARVVTSLELSSYAFSTMNYKEEDVFGLLEHGRARQNLNGDRLRNNGVTLSRGGPLSPGYLRMNEPFPGPFGEPTRGKTFLSHDIERRVVEYCLDHKLRMNMVLGGYRDNDEFIETLRRSGRDKEIRDGDWVLQHCYFTSPSQMEAYAEYGFHITTSASFVYGKADRVKRDFPASAAADFIAMRRFLDKKLNLACGTDWGPDNPWRQMALNETREGAESGHHHLEQGNALGRLESLQAFTRAGAAVMQRPDIGSLGEGMAADLVIVDRDPLTCDVAALAETQVLRTMVDGEAVYDSGALRGGPMALPPDASTLIADVMKGLFEAS